MRTLDSVTLNWCNKHQNWWVTNCPDCTIDSNENDIRKAGIKEVVELLRVYNPWVGSLKPPGGFEYLLETPIWQAKKKEWGIE